jgi:spermidine synthase
VWAKVDAMWLKQLLAVVVAMAASSFPAMAEPPCASEGPTAPRVLFQKASKFGRVYVVEQGGMRHLRFGSACGFDQSSVSTSKPKQVVTEYVRLATLSLALAVETDRILMIGLGGGSFSNLVVQGWPDAQIDAVEIDPVVVEAAERFFGVRPSPTFRIHTADGAAFLARGQQDYDVIFLDTYSGEGMPAHLATSEYFESVARHLRRGGVVVANFGLDEPGQYIALAGRGAAPARGAPGGSGHEDANLVVFAGKRETLRRDDPLSLAAALDQQDRLPFSLAELALGVRDCL